MFGLLFYKCGLLDCCLMFVNHYITLDYCLGIAGLLFNVCGLQDSCLMLVDNSNIVLSMWLARLLSNIC